MGPRDLSTTRMFKKGFMGDGLFSFNRCLCVLYIDDRYVYARGKLLILLDKGGYGTLSTADEPGFCSREVWSFSMSLLMWLSWVIL